MPILIPLGKSGVRNTAVDVAAPPSSSRDRLSAPWWYVHQDCHEGFDWPSDRLGILVLKGLPKMPTRDLGRRFLTGIYLGGCYHPGGVPTLVIGLGPSAWVGITRVYLKS